MKSLYPSCKKLAILIFIACTIGVKVSFLPDDKRLNTPYSIQLLHYTSYIDVTIRIITYISHITVKNKSYHYDNGSTDFWLSFIDNPEIRLKELQNNEKKFTVLKGKPLEIVIEQEKAQYITCYNSYASDQYIFLDYTKLKNDNYQTIKVQNVTSEMSTRWVCLVLEEFHGNPYTYNNRNYTAVTFNFNLHVKQARSVILSANDRSLPYDDTSLADGFDGHAHYNFLDGEDIYFTCTGKAVPYDCELSLKYYDAQGNQLFKSKYRRTEPHIFKSTLKAKNNNYHLDCICKASSDPKFEYRFRTTFHLKKRNIHYDSVEHNVSFFINGRQLKDSYEIGSYDYVYRFIDGEIIDISCRKINPKTKGPVIILMDNDPLPHQNFTITFDTTKGITNRRSIKCGIKNTDENPFTTIQFLSDLPELDARIVGLPKENILYEYTSDPHRWVIKYEYSANDKLTLACVTKTYLRYDDSQFIWKFNKIRTSSKRKLKGMIHFANDNFTATLNESVNGYKLQCIYEIYQPSLKKTVEVEFVLKKEDSETISDATSSRDGITSSYGDDDNINLKVLYPVSAGIIVLLIAIICLISRRIKSKKRHLIENVYDHFSNENGSQIPTFPRQWENNDDSHYTKIDEGAVTGSSSYERGYDKMSHRRRSTTSEHHYTEIDEYIKPKANTVDPNWNNTEVTNVGKERASELKLNNTRSFRDPIQDTFSTLGLTNLSINNDLYSTTEEREVIGDTCLSCRKERDPFKPIRNRNEAYTFPNDQRFKGNSPQNGFNDSNVHLQGGTVDKINYENHSVQNEIDNALVYAEPYAELGIKRLK